MIEVERASFFFYFVLALNSKRVNMVCGYHIISQCSMLVRRGSASERIQLKALLYYYSCLLIERIL